MALVFENIEKTDKELCEGWVENFHSYFLKLSEANKGFLELTENMVLKNRITTIGKDIQDVLQDIKNIP